MTKKLAILGCTGSIGTSTLKVVEKGDFSVGLLANYSDGKGLRALIEKFRPAFAVCVSDNYLYCGGKEYLLPDGFLSDPATYVDVDLVVNGIAGLAGLLPTLGALRAGKPIATANKESFVCAGSLITAASKRFSAPLYPVDSEHSAAWQLLHNNLNAQKIVITASGGAFRDLTREELAFAKARDALNHPNWLMGKKVTIDCATLVNKGMELIEAKHLFHLPCEAIGHRESIVHAMVHNKDGSVLAHLSKPDMVSPISYALHYPASSFQTVPTMDLTEIGALRFFKLDRDRFPSLSIAEEANKMGDIAGCVFSVADEVLVSRYLADEIGFYDLSDGIRHAFDTFAEPGDFSSTEAVFCMEKKVKEYTLNMRFGGRK